MILGPLRKVSVLLMKNVIRPLAKIVLIPLELTTAAPAAGEIIHKTILGWGTATFIHKNILGLWTTTLQAKKWKKLRKSLEDSGLLINNAHENIENK